jgi:farnesol dehydrogenase
MRVLVTGGTGYLGRAIVRALVARAHEPVVFSRSGAASDGARAFTGDVRDRSALAHGARGCDAICHSAALVSMWRPRRADFDDVNVGGLRNVLAIAREMRIPRVVYTSSFLALPPTGANRPVELNDYQRTKVIADSLARSAAVEGAPIVVTYPGVIYGPGSMTEGNLVGRTLADHLAGRLPGVVGARRLWSYAFVDDVADAHVAALERGRIGARYRLGGENATQMRQFEIVRERLGTPLPSRIPFLVAAALGIEEQTRAALLGSPPLLTLGTARILARDWALDCSLAERELGYRPRPLAAGLDLLLGSLTPAG